MVTALELADTMIATAEQNYRRDGHLAPTLILFAPKRQVYCSIGEGDDIPLMGSKILLGLAAVVQPDFAVLISEVWMRRDETLGRSLEEAEANYERGQLQREEEAGDPSVMTALMVHVLDCKHYESSHLRLTVDHGDRLEREPDMPGVGEGRVPEMMIASYENGMRFEPPTFDLELLAAILGKAGLITAMAIEEEKPGVNN